MSDINEKNISEQDLPETYTLTDDSGNEFEVELLAAFEFEGKQYRAITPIEPQEKAEPKKGEPEAIEYDILEVSEDENGEEILSSIEDDEEFDKIADFFDDVFFGQIDYDE